MIQFFKKRKSVINEYNSHINHNYPLTNNHLKNKEIEKSIVNYIFRNISFINNNNMIKQLTENNYLKISSETNLSKYIVRFYVEKLFFNMKNLRKFLKKIKLNMIQ